MATLNRRPLINRSLQPQSTVSPTKPQRTISGSKRPRSPEISIEHSARNPLTKRVRAFNPSPVSQIPDKAKERKYIEREQQKAEFKEKFTRAFPGFIFYFDELNITPDVQDRFEDMIEQLGGKTVKFLDKAVTHFISNRTDGLPTVQGDKENSPKPGNILKSPIKLKGRVVEDIEITNTNPPSSTLKYKFWNTVKLDSVLTRLLDPLVPHAHTRTSSVKKQATSLARLLKSEQIHGTTERDPTQKRHDFRYFGRGSKFILVEDIRQELATIAVQEYSLPKTRDGITAKNPWPVLHCHPQARGPFIAFDEKEKRRWEKLQMAEGEQKAEGKEYSRRLRQAEIMKKKAEASLHARFPGARIDECSVDPHGEGENLNSIIAPGFLPSGTAGYMAASGNSVHITSTTGTTSTAGYTTRNLQLPSALSGRMKHVLTSRKFPSTVADKENTAPSMGPPTVIPGRQPLLRKSRSTNTLKLPQREEGVKPGYCESCRAKFDNFKAHINSRKHQRFATNDANFLQLDCVLARVQRRTKEQVLSARIERVSQRKFCCSSARDSENISLETNCAPPRHGITHHCEGDHEVDINMQGNSDACV